MARSQNFTRPYAQFVFLPLMPLLFFAGCRSSSCCRNNHEGGCCGGGGGGCCRGATPTNPPAVAASSPSPVVDFTAAAPTSQSGSVAANASPASALVTQSPYGGQKTCPVTGHELGSMGTPIPVAVNGQTIYVCCRGCVAKVQANPDFYLQKVQAERGGKSHGTSSQNNNSSLSSRSDSSGGSCCHSGGGGCCHGSP